jgi:hypothetical protein
MKKTLSLCLSLFLLWVPSLNAQTMCALNNAGEIITDNNGYVDCYASAGQQKLKIQYLALCQSLPTVSNYQEQCDELFDEPVGKEAILSKGVIIDFVEGRTLSLKEGTYTHAAIRIDSLIQMKSQFLFDKPLLGGAGGVGKTCWTAATGTVGTYSDSQDYLGYSSLDQLATQCGNTANPEFTAQDFDAFSGPGGFTNNITGRSSPTGPYDMYTLETPNSLSDPTPGALNGKHLLGIQTFNEPVVISPFLQSLDFGFKLDGMFHLQANWQSNTTVGDNPNRKSGGGGSKYPEECIKDQSSGNSCFVYVIPTGFEFSVSTE